MRLGTLSEQFAQRTGLRAEDYWQDEVVCGSPIRLLDVRRLKEDLRVPGFDTLREHLERVCGREIADWILS